MRKVTLKVYGDIWCKGDIDISGGHHAKPYVDSIKKKVGKTKFGKLVIGSDIEVFGDLYVDEILFDDGVIVNILCAGELSACVNI